MQYIMKKINEGIEKLGGWDLFVKSGYKVMLKANLFGHIEKNRTDELSLCPNNGRNMRKEASIEQWNELYDVTINIKKLEPWNYLWDMDIITIILPGYEEPFYCSVMGRGGQCYI